MKSSNQSSKSVQFNLDESATVFPKSNEFSQETAKSLLKNGGTLIVENFPVGSEFGIDLSIHYTGDKFMGIKMIPAGVHFIYFSLVDGQQQCVGPRNGFFHFFKPGEILITRWNSNENDIVLNSNTDQSQRLKSAFTQGSLDAHLG